jgi:hypothetical protein
MEGHNREDIFIPFHSARRADGLSAGSSAGLSSRKMSKLQRLAVTARRRSREELSPLA